MREQAGNCLSLDGGLAPFQLRAQMLPTATPDQTAER